MPNSNENIELVVAPLNRSASGRYYFVILIALLLVALGGYGVWRTLSEGLSAWGINNSVPWAVDITNFVFWIGIGHAGTLVSAILLLFGSHWRKSINRSAELMTIVALVCAAFFPLIHAGRPYFAWYWLFPYPNEMSLLPNFRSPIVWDIMAILTYFSVSLIFWYMGLIPDLYRAKPYLRSKRKQYLYELFSLGWNGSSGQVAAHSTAYRVVAGLATALVVSVHSVVSFDFAVTDVAGWHSTVFPIYFVAGAIFSGCAMVSMLIVLLRYAYRLESMITEYNLDNLNKTLLATGIILAFLYLADIGSLAISRNPADNAAFTQRFSGSNAFFALCVGFCCFVLPHLFWSRKVRVSPLAILPVCLGITFGMWCERYSFIVPSLEASQTSQFVGTYAPTITELSIFAGTVGFFIILLMLAFRAVPIVSLWETTEK